MIYWVNPNAVTPDSSGGTRHFELSRFLLAQGEAVTILASDFHYVTRSYRRRSSERDRGVVVETVEGVRFEWLYASPYSQNDWRRLLNMLSFAWSVFWRLCSVAVDRDTVFIGSSPHLFGALATRLAAALRRVPFVFEVRDLWPESLVDMTGRRGLEAWALQRIANYLYGSSQSIIVLALPSREHIARLGFNPQKITYIPNGVDPQAFAEASSRPSPIPLLPGKTVLVYAGAHGPANDLEVIVHAAAVLQSRRIEDIHIVLVGDGPTKPAVEELARELQLNNLTLHDPIPKLEIPALLHAVDAGILTLKDAAVFRFGVSPNKLFDYLAAGLPVLSNVQGEVASILESSGCGVVVPPSDPQALAEGMIALRDRVRENPDFGVAGLRYVEEHHNRARLVDRLHEVIRRVRAAPRAESSKRLLDISLSLAAFAVLWPVMLLVAVAIRFSMGSPVLFCQERPGLGGRPFVMYKFRTMNHSVDPEGRLLPDAHRLTPLGRFLRATSLDELPELLNVLKGEMSLVGPRPLLMEYLPLYTPEQARRHEVRPGITGWAQVNGRNTLSWEERFKLDVWYIDHWSLALDLKILWLTLLKVLRREGVAHEGHATMPKFEGSRDA